VSRIGWHRQRKLAGIICSIAAKSCVAAADALLAALGVCDLACAFAADGGSNHMRHSGAIRD
jgi:hypothetical protein